MRTWIKYLVIGWSIVSVGIVIVSFQLMKSEFIEEKYSIMLVYKTPISSDDGWTMIAEDIFYDKRNPDPLYNFDQTITKNQFVDKMKKAKGISMESNNKLKNAGIYIILPIYAFLVWGIPILVFSLVGIIFGRVRKPETKEAPDK